jgi:predicted transcriptional regulator
VRVSLPDELLQHAATLAEQREKPIGELYVEAIEGYVATHATTSAGALRSRAAIIPRGSPQLSIELPEDLLKRSSALAKRLNKRRDAMYAEALAGLVLREAPSTAASAFDRGHDLPSGAWRSKVSE